MLSLKLLSSAFGRASLLPSINVSKVLPSASTFLPTASLGSTGLIGGALYFQSRDISRHGGNIDFRRDFFIKKERPVGPHKILPPNFKFEGRVGPKVNYHYIVHYPKDGKYTIKKLKMKKLGGRDPVTGRKVVQGIRGGAKRLFRWIDYRRFPKDRDPNLDLEEKIINICYDPNRHPMIALTGYDDKLRWQIATDSMKVGDIIRTTRKIPVMAVKPIPGDSYPLGALPAGTTICLVQWYPDSDEVQVYNARDSAKIIRKVGDRVIIERANKHQYSLDQTCQCVVGTVSIHPLKALPIGSPNRLRWLGIGPRSGLWHRKSGIHGRKIRKLPPVEVINAPQPPKDFPLLLHCDTEGLRGQPALRKRPLILDKW